MRPYCNVLPLLTPYSSGVSITPVDFSAGYRHHSTVNGKFNILINFTLHPSGQFVAKFLVGVILMVWESGADRRLLPHSKETGASETGVTLGGLADVCPAAHYTLSLRRTWRILGRYSR